jgi:hypothetical protein
MTVINRFEAWIDVILKPVLESLRNVKAKVFEIKLNVELFEELKSVLGDVGFVTILGKRPYNEHLYGTINSLEVGRRTARIED